MNTIAPPEIIPASAPCQFERLQKRANNTTGPNTAPKPAHAKETMPNTELFGSRAIKAAITAMASKVKRAAFIAFFLSPVLATLSPKRSEDTAEDADQKL